MSNVHPTAVHEANVFLPGSLGPVRREVVLAYEYDRVVDALAADNRQLRGALERLTSAATDADIGYLDAAISNAEAALAGSKDGDL